MWQRPADLKVHLPAYQTWTREQRWRCHGLLRILNIQSPTELLHLTHDDIRGRLSATEMLRRRQSIRTLIHALQKPTPTLHDELLRLHPPPRSWRFSASLTRAIAATGVRSQDDIHERLRQGLDVPRVLLRALGIPTSPQPQLTPAERQWMAADPQRGTWYPDFKRSWLQQHPGAIGYASLRLVRILDPSGGNLTSLTRAQIEHALPLAVVESAQDVRSLYHRRRQSRTGAAHVGHAHRSSCKTLCAAAACLCPTSAEGLSLPVVERAVQRLLPPVPIDGSVTYVRDRPPWNPSRTF